MLFINHNAYTIISIEGLSFCTSARKAFVLIVENSLRIATINSVGDFLLFLSKLTVSIITTIIAIFFLQVQTTDVINARWKFVKRKKIKF